MKKIILTLLTLLLVLHIGAQETHSVGSNANFRTYRFDNEFFLILSFKDDDENRLMEESTVKFLLSDGNVIKLEGTNGSKRIKTSKGFWSDYESKETHYALFYITQEQIEMLKVGVEKVAINTIPEVYKRDSWAGKGSFGQKLHKEFKAMKDEFE